MAKKKPVKMVLITIPDDIKQAVTCDGCKLPMIRSTNYWVCPKMGCSLLVPDQSMRERMHKHVHPLPDWLWNRLLMIAKNGWRVPKTERATWRQQDAFENRPGVA